MKENEKNTKDKWLHLRLSEAELQELKRQFSKTTEQKLSGYARKILLGKPMIASYRNQSLQDILSVLLKLQKDLNGVANNYNQAVHKLHTLDHIPQFRVWLDGYESDRKRLLKDIGEIRFFISKTAEKWLQ